MIAGKPKNPNNVTHTFFNAIHLLPEDLRFENGGHQTCFLLRAQSKLVWAIAYILYRELHRSLLKKRARPAFKWPKYVCINFSDVYTC